MPQAQHHIGCVVGALKQFLERFFYVLSAEKVPKPRLHCFATHSGQVFAVVWFPLTRPLRLVLDFLYALKTIAEIGERFLGVTKNLGQEYPSACPPRFWLWRACYFCPRSTYLLLSVITSENIVKRSMHIRQHHFISRSRAIDLKIDLCPKE